LFGLAFAFPLPALAIFLSNLGVLTGRLQIINDLISVPLIVFPVSIGYAIAKHNLFDVDVYVKRAVGYGIMTAIVGLTYFSIQVGVKAALQPVFGEYSEKIYPVIFAMLIVFLFHPINRKVQKTVDKLFYRKKFDYKETITKVSDALTSVLDLSEVINKIIHTVRKEMFIDKAGVLLLEPQKKECQTFFVGDEADTIKANGNECIKYDDPMIDLISENKKLITVYDIAEDPHYSHVKKTCSERFSRMGVSMMLPLIYQGEVKGALALGYKKSGHFYTREDIDLLNTLANHGAVAIENAKLVEQAKKEEIMRTNLSRYLSPQIVDHIIKHDVEVNLGGDRKVVTVMFLDIIGFTALSEQLEPEEVVSILNEYFKEMSNAIFRWEGTLDKFIGDEIMAFWGAPIEQPDHAELAVRCALNLSKALDELREKWKREGRPVIDCGIGINTGEVLVGNIGVEGKKMDYTIIGDTVNLASRIEKLTRQYKTRMLITENTFEHIRESIDLNKFGHVKVTDLDEVKVRGKEKGVKIYKLELTDEMPK
jgi:class 3 adenylate cyclase